MAPAFCSVCGTTDQTKLTRCDFVRDIYGNHCGTLVCFTCVHSEGYGDERDIVDGRVFLRCPTHANPDVHIDRIRESVAAQDLLIAQLVRACAGCGADFLNDLERPPLCATCAQVQPCGHSYADTVEDAAGQPFCARCLEESRSHADHH